MSSLQKYTLTMFMSFVTISFFQATLYTLHNIWDLNRWLCLAGTWLAWSLLTWCLFLFKWKLVFQTMDTTIAQWTGKLNAFFTHMAICPLRTVHLRWVTFYKVDRKSCSSAENTKTKKIQKNAACDLSSKLLAPLRIVPLEHFAKCLEI